MLQAIGVILILWYLGSQFNQSFQALDEAGSAVFEAIEVAADKTARNMD